MNDPSSQWHSIRPWRPTLSLAVREITSVSATFIISSPLASCDDLTTNDGSDEDDDSEEDIPESDVVREREEGRRGNGAGAAGNMNKPPQHLRQTQIVSDALSKGLSVKVNGTPWQRVLIKGDDEADEAVVILFGLMPGRQYDVELGIVPGDNSLRSQITTELAAQPLSDNGFSVFDLSSHAEQQQHLSSSSMLSVSSNSSGNVSLPSSPSSTSHLTTIDPTFSLEDRRLQLTHTLSQLNNEHATLTATLKTARREAQKADAALRSEIETLKRASEKNAGQEHRARQKVLALQEAVRRTVAATEEVRAMIAEVEGLLPGLETRRKEVEGEWEKVRADAKAVREQREEAEREEGRRLEAMQSEMAVLGNRLEKLGMKREKLEGEGGVLNDLEEKLRRLEEARNKVESDPYGNEEEFSDDLIFHDDDDDDDVKRRRGSQDEQSGDSPSSDQYPHAQLHPPGLPPHPHLNHRQHPANHQPTHNPHARKRHSHPAHSRNVPSPQHPIQRPSHNSRLSLPAGPGVIHLNKSPTSPVTSPSSTSSMPQSTLSGCAPPFEPGRRPPLPPNHSSGSVRSDLNPGSSPFAPRSGVAIAAISSPTAKKSVHAMAK